MSLPPLIAGVPDRDEAATSDCGCCAGTEVETPAAIANRPGLGRVAYRIGTFGDFRESQLARLSAAENPALSTLKSRETDDFSIALIDAWSVVCDVLSFYQERGANEAFLGTALERRSLVELGRLIGYRLRPGVAASTDLVFQLSDPPGAAVQARGQTGSPAAATDAVTIPARTRVQSVPGPDEQPQTFETGADLDARVAWNALLPRQTRRRGPAMGDRGVWLQGVTTQLKVGDAIVVVGSERLDHDPGSEAWDFRRVAAIAPDAEMDRTWIGFAPGLGSTHPFSSPTKQGARVFALRARASLFGWNAPHPLLLSDSARSHYGFKDDDNSDWAFSISGSEIVLDGVQDGWIAGSLVALTAPTYTELYRIKAVVDDGVAAYAVSARATRLELDIGENLDVFAKAYRGVSAYGKSEELAFAETPLLDPVTGDAIELAGQVAGLGEGRRLVVRGRLAQALIAAPGLTLTDADDTAPLAVGERVTLIAAPRQMGPGSTSCEFRLRTPGGFEGGIVAPLASFTFVEAEATTEIAAEPATLAAIDAADETHSILALAAPLARAYDRASARVHANVADATHGETTQEILGSGDAALAFQSFRLKQAPLTYTSAANASGAASSLEVRVGGVLWHEAPTLYGTGALDRQFETRATDDGATVVQFGDGVTGARPASGQNNLVATYRKGIGRAGSVRAGTLTTALDRPLGLRDVFNPVAAAGGEDPETDAALRADVPVTTLTLGRVVSLQNYEDFARGFAGISLAKADWAWDGEARRILVSIAGPGGAPVDPAAGDLFGNLVQALRTLGDSLVRLSVASYRPATFKLALSLIVDPDYQAKPVLAAVEAALRDAWSIERRGFAPLVAASAVLATAQTVPGVVAVDLDTLYRTTPPSTQPILHDRLLARPATLGPAGELLAAEILSLDPAPLALTVSA